MFNSVGDGGMICVDEALGFVALMTWLSFVAILEEICVYGLVFRYADPA